MNKQFIREQELLLDSYRLAVQVYASGFRPDFIVGVWRGGSTVGIYVQECLQYLGISSDHIKLMVVACLIMLIGMVMDEGRKINDENKLTV